MNTMSPRALWKDYCDATVGIAERFGRMSAIQFLLGEKLMSFAQLGETDPTFLAELPAFSSSIRGRDAHSLDYFVVMQIDKCVVYSNVAITRAPDLFRVAALVVALTLSVATFTSSAFGGFGVNQSQLKGAFIAEVGEAHEVEPPSGAKWKDQIYSLNSRCFTLSGYFGYWGYGGKPAMLVVKENKLINLALFESLGSTPSVDLFPVQMVQCPESANVLPSCDGLTSEQCQKAMADHLRMLEQKLKQLRGK